MKHFTFSLNSGKSTKLDVLIINTMQEMGLKDRQQFWEKVADNLISKNFKFKK